MSICFIKFLGVINVMEKYQISLWQISPLVIKNGVQLGKSLRLTSDTEWAGKPRTH